MQKQSILSSVLVVVAFIIYTSTASAVATLEVKNNSASETQAIELYAVQPDPIGDSGEEVPSPSLEPGTQVAPSQPKVLPLPDTTKPELDTGEDAESVGAFMKFDGIDGESEDKKKTERLLWGNTQGPSTAAKTSKPKEIVVVGSKNKTEQSLKGKKILENFKPAEPILTSEELQDYAEGIAEVDKNIKKIVLNDEEIKLDYKQPAKLFGFIPIKMSISSSVDKQGAVKVKFPWYSFLTRHSLSDLKTKIEAAVSEMNKAELIDTMASEAGDEDSDSDSFEDPDETSKLNEETSLDLQNVMQKQQQVLQTMGNVMKTMHDTASGIIRNLK